MTSYNKMYLIPQLMYDSFLKKTDSSNVNYTRQFNSLDVQDGGKVVIRNDDHNKFCGDNKKKTPSFSNATPPNFSLMNQSRESDGQPSHDASQNHSINQRNQSDFQDGNGTIQGGEENTSSVPPPKPFFYDDFSGENTADGGEGNASLAPPPQPFYGNFSGENNSEFDSHFPIRSRLLNNRETDLNQSFHSATSNLDDMVTLDEVNFTPLFTSEKKMMESRVLACKQMKIR